MEIYNTPALDDGFAHYLSGYADGEGCFSVSFSVRPKLKVGWEVKPSFAVGQNADRAEVLLQMQRYFNCGFIRINRSDKTIKYEVRSLDDLVGKILPHFEQYPLRSSKQRDVILLSKICSLMQENQHLSKDGLRKIIHLAYQMNISGKRKFPESEILQALSR